MDRAGVVRCCTVSLLGILLNAVLVVPAWGQGAGAPSASFPPTAGAPQEAATTHPATDRFADREDGVPSSMFGTYIRSGELLVYPFFEYYLDDDYEYQPSDFGATGELDYRGRYRAREYLLFLGYGISRRVAFELEAAAISATLDKAPDDPSDLPLRLDESGLGDIEAQLRWRWNPDELTGGEWFSYFETVFPTQDQGRLIGTSDWEFKLGTGWLKALHWGTITVRAAVAIDTAEKKPEIGEYAFEYLKRLSPLLRVFAAVEGSEDELELITEAQLHLGSHVIVKLNNAFGITSKATDWAPEVGVMLSIPVAR